MTRADELKTQIAVKRDEVERYRNLNQMQAAMKAVDELEKLMDEYKVANALETAKFDNFMDAVKSGNVTKITPSGDGGKYSGYSATDDYKKHFFNAIRGNFKNSDADFLRGSVDNLGGYLIPSEMDAQIVTKLAELNPMRQISRVIETNSKHEVPIMSSQPTAQWLSEGQKIELEGGNFDQVTLGAYKLCAGIRLSNELLQDSFYNLQDFFTVEFSKAMASAEEQSFISGNGTTEPQGIMALASDTDSVVTTASTDLTIDDLIDTTYSLPRAYRSNACWLVHDSTLQAIRKIKDSNLQMYWTASTTEGEPPILLGYPVYSSGYMPQYASANVIAVFGNFQQGYVIGDRAVRTFKALTEVLALNDLSVFIAIERVDGRVIDKNAFKLLKLR